MKKSHMESEYEKAYAEGWEYAETRDYDPRFSAKEIGVYPDNQYLRIDWERGADACWLLKRIRDLGLAYTEAPDDWLKLRRISDVYICQTEAAICDPLITEIIKLRKKIKDLKSAIPGPLNEFVGI